MGRIAVVLRRAGIGHRGLECGLQAYLARDYRHACAHSGPYSARDRSDPDTECQAQAYSRRGPEVGMTLLLLQMTTVLLTALVFGWIARKLGQARVIGEIIGGIFLGPSVFGRIAPHASASLFPVAFL